MAAKGPRVNLTLKRQAGRAEEVRVLTLEVAGWLSSTLVEAARAEAEAKGKALDEEAVAAIEARFPDTGEELFRASGFQSGVWLCQLVQRTVPEDSLPAALRRLPHPEAQPSTFQARDNLACFIEATMALGEHKIRRVEPEDVVAQRNNRQVLYLVLGLAKDLFLRFNVRPPEVVAMEMEIDRLEASGAAADVGAADLARALEHVPYEAVAGDYVDAWIAAFVNQNRVPLVAVPSRLPVPPEGGQYIFPYEPEPHRVYHVRMVRGTPLYRDGGEWKELAELIRSKMAKAYAEAGRPMPKLELPKGVKPPRPAGEPIVQEAMARLDELKAIEKDQCIYVAGKDEQGRNVVVIVGSRLPPLSDERMYHVLLFLALTLDRVGRSEYAVVYCHTRAQFARKYFKWIKKARHKLPYVFKKNLKDLHIMHPSFFIKACFGFLRPFISKKFWRKLHYYNSRSTDQINERIAPLEAGRVLPPFVNLHGKHNYDAGKLFGGTLETAAIRDLGQGEQYTERVPRVVYETVEFIRSTALDEEGLFRVPGQKKDEAAVRSLYEKDDDVQWLRGTYSPHVAASVLKAYLRELGEPLVPEALFDDVLRAGDAAAAAEAGEGDPPAAEVARIVAAVPDANRCVLSYLAFFLAEVAAHAEANKMSSANLALVVAPNLVRRADEPADEMLANAKRKAAAFQYMLEHAAELFQGKDEPDAATGAGDIPEGEE